MEEQITIRKLFEKIIEEAGQNEYGFSESAFLFSITDPKTGKSSMLLPFFGKEEDFYDFLDEQTRKGLVVESGGYMTKEVAEAYIEMIDKAEPIVK